MQSYLMGFVGDHVLKGCRVLQDHLKVEVEEWTNHKHQRQHHESAKKAHGEVYIGLTCLGHLLELPHHCDDTDYSKEDKA